MLKKLFSKLTKESVAQRESKKAIDTYNINSLTEIYFPGINQEIQRKRKMERFFASLNTEV